MELLDQIDAAAGGRSYYLALMGALTVPDIAGALASPTGRASARSYENWVQGNLPWWGDTDRAGLLYHYRSTMLHQNRASADERKGLPRLLFREPNLEYNVLVHNASITKGESRAIIIDTREFCNEVTSAGRVWLDRNSHDGHVVRNLDQSLRRYEHGLSPFMTGVSLIG
ncbi:hypothetical protein [Curtobacterium sp. PhB172]|uniref:hypothetical protein n=1 Tax=Curtobacterium sp. PhB172 TaxID=2485196 RepID=UPI00160CC1F1|nr:hypothetical protein [Curtobacterium sp. PhB172]